MGLCTESDRYVLYYYASAECDLWTVGICCNKKQTTFGGNSWDFRLLFFQIYFTWFKFLTFKFLTKKMTTFYDNVLFFINSAVLLYVANVSCNKNFEAAWRVNLAVVAV